MQIKLSATTLLARTAFLLGVMVLPVAGYGQNPTGTLRGDVQDPKGARVPAATVMVQAVGSSSKRQIKSDDHGEFRLSELLPGTYHVTVDAPGFSQAQSDVAVIVSSVRDITVTMNPATVKETVNVQARPSSITTQQIDLASAVHQAAVSTQDLQNLPLAARSFANIAYLAPGTEPVEPSDPTKARITATDSATGICPGGHLPYRWRPAGSYEGKVSKKQNCRRRAM